MICRRFYVGDLTVYVSLCVKQDRIKRTSSDLSLRKRSEATPLRRSPRKHQNSTPPRRSPRKHDSSGPLKRSSSTPRKSSKRSSAPLRRSSSTPSKRVKIQGNVAMDSKKESVDEVEKMFASTDEEKASDDKDDKFINAADPTCWDCEKKIRDRSDCFPEGSWGSIDQVLFRCKSCWTKHCANLKSKVKLESEPVKNDKN